MARLRFLNNMNPKTPLRILLVAGASSAALAAFAVLLFVRTVQADALLPQHSVTLPQAASVGSVTPASLAPKRTSDLFHGEASWYGGVFNGRKTASGERYNMYAMTACHPTLPFGTVVRVRNLINNKTVDVRITDRGYLFAGRIIDVSYAAAQKLSMIRHGVTPVEIQVLSVVETASNK
jgi:rare lipoprotein A